MTPRSYIMKFGGIVLSGTAFVAIGISFSDEVLSQVARFAADDPGVRKSSSVAGMPRPGLSDNENRAFEDGKKAFQEVASVHGDIPNTEAGLAFQSGQLRWLSYVSRYRREQSGH